MAKRAGLRTSSSRTTFDGTNKTYVHARTLDEQQIALWGANRESTSSLWQTGPFTSGKVDSGYFVWPQWIGIQIFTSTPPTAATVENIARHKFQVKKGETVLGEWPLQKLVWGAGLVPQRIITTGLTAGANHVYLYPERAGGLDLTRRGTNYVGHQFFEGENGFVEYPGLFMLLSGESFEFIISPEHSLVGGSMTDLSIYAYMDAIEVKTK